MELSSRFSILVFLILKYATHSTNSVDWKNDCRHQKTSTINDFTNLNNIGNPIQKRRKHDNAVGAVSGSDELEKARYNTGVYWE
jgi:hypothetical protein